jgi:TonB family protein
MRCVALVLAAVILAGPVTGIAAPETGGGAPAAKRPDVSLPLEGVVTDPDWIETPNGDDFATYFPPVAAMLSLGGRVVMRCQVSTTGTLDDCTITNEAPAGLGFGEAALKISQYFRMKPMSVDGASVAGGKINIPIRFAPSEQPPDDPSASEAEGLQPSPKALELARRIAATGFGPQQMQLYVDQARKFIGQRFNGVSLTEQQQAAIEDYLQAIAVTGPQRADALAHRYAREFTEQQLVDISAFLESPAGKAWMSRGTDDAAQTAVENERLEKAAEEDARNRFCSKYDCLKTAAPAAAPQVKK